MKILILFLSVLLLAGVLTRQVNYKNKWAYHERAVAQPDTVKWVFSCEDSLK